MRGWLKLSSPIALGSLEFPYRFEIKETGQSTPRTLKAGDRIKQGGKYEMVLKAPSASLKNNNRLLTEFWVCVINIDTNGRATDALKGGAETTGCVKFDGSNFNAQDPPNEISLRPLRCIWEPFGTEAFIMLVTSRNIGDAGALEFAGVRGSQNTTRGGEPSDLDELLHNIGVEVTNRGQYSTSQTNAWAVQHLILQSEGTTGYVAAGECKL